VIDDPNGHAPGVVSSVSSERSSQKSVSIVIGVYITLDEECLYYVMTPDHIGWTEQLCVEGNKYSLWGIDPGLQRSFHSIVEKDLKKRRNRETMKVEYLRALSDDELFQMADAMLSSSRDTTSVR